MVVEMRVLLSQAREVQCGCAGRRGPEQSLPQPWGEPAPRHLDLGFQPPEPRGSCPWFQSLGSCPWIQSLARGASPGAPLGSAASGASGWRPGFSV